MENKINIAKILKDCPKGMELYSPLCGTCVFDRLNMGTIICKKQNTQDISFTSEGYYMLPVFDNCECMIFPSKDQRDWSKFQRPFKDGDIVATKNGLFIGIVKVKNNIQVNTYCAIGISGSFSMNIAYGFERFATEEEKQKLFQAIRENGYKWNPETKTLEKLIKVQPYKEETKDEKIDLLQQLKDYFDNTPREVVEKEWHDYDKYNEIAPTVNEYLEYVNKIRQPKNPKTYDECCKIISVPIRNSIGGHKWKILQEFQKLLVCLDAYWKIAGEQMGLGKPWKPDWREERYIIYRNQDDIIGGYREAGYVEHHILAFPTKEMRDAFKENFDGDIDVCKEFL